MADLPVVGVATLGPLGQPLGNECMPVAEPVLLGLPAGRQGRVGRRVDHCPAFRGCPGGPRVATLTTGRSATLPNKPGGSPEAGETIGADLGAPEAPLTATRVCHT